MAGTYARMAAAPVGLKAALLAVPRGIIAGADVILTILFVGGAFAFLDATGALARLVGMLGWSGVRGGHELSSLLSVWLSPRSVPLRICRRKSLRSSQCLSC